jgi:hypothetical protein
MAFNKIALIFFGILVYMNPAVELLADRVPFDSYALPHEKSILDSCRQLALKAIPGKVKAFQIHNTTHGFHYRFEIEAQDRTAWEVVCDAASRKITQTQRKELN